LTGSLICGFGMLLLGDGPKAVTRWDWLVLSIAALVPLAIGVPGNLDRLSETSNLFKRNRQIAYAVAHSRYIDDVPADLRPLQDNGSARRRRRDGWRSRRTPGASRSRTSPCRPTWSSRRPAGWF
jgi:hypothetical protein